MGRASQLGASDAASVAVQIYDTTLRDGTQREGISLSVEDKLRVAQRLDALGVAFVEGGWPGSNPKDVEFFARARELSWDNTAISAFGCTRRAGVDAAADAQLSSLLEAETPVCTIFGKTWTLHVTEVLRTELDENLRMIEQSVHFLRAAGRRVIYDAEHFFDGYTADATYALETLHAAVRGGVEAVVLCDTNGGSLPEQVRAATACVVADLERTGMGHVVVGIHAHNDGECAVANSLAAVQAGARHVQGTINGYGERCGNANLCAVVPNLELKLGLRALPEGHLARLPELSHFVAEVSNLPFDDHMAYVGRSAFAHKGGVHVAAMRRHTESYQHIDPELVGNRSRVVVSELSGRGNVLSKAEEFGLRVEGPLGTRVLDRIKRDESTGLSYEAAEASVALLIQRETDVYTPPFDVIDYQVMAGRRRAAGRFSEATVKLQVGQDVMHTAAEGNGPVDALDAALRKALIPVYPEIATIHLADYKVRILDGSMGTSAVTRVLVSNHCEDQAWSTVGASDNIIEASLRALVDGLEYGLLRLRSGLDAEDGADRDQESGPDAERLRRAEAPRKTRPAIPAAIALTTPER